MTDNKPPIWIPIAIQVGALRLPNDEVARIAAHFTPPAYAPEAATDRLDPAIEACASWPIRAWYRGSRPSYHRTNAPEESNLRKP